jgi:hypothetical protein
MSLVRRAKKCPAVSLFTSSQSNVHIPIPKGGQAEVTLEEERLCLRALNQMLANDEKNGRCVVGANWCEPMVQATMHLNSQDAAKSDDVHDARHEPRMASQSREDGEEAFPVT